MRPLAFAGMAALAAVLGVGLVAARRATSRQVADLAARIERIGLTQVPPPDDPDDRHAWWLIQRDEDRPAVPVTPWQRAHHQGGRR